MNYIIIIIIIIIILKFLFFQRRVSSSSLLISRVSTWRVKHAELSVTNKPSVVRISAMIIGKTAVSILSGTSSVATGNSDSSKSILWRLSIYIPFDRYLDRNFPPLSL